MGVEREQGEPAVVAAAGAAAEEVVAAAVAAAVAAEVVAAEERVVGGTLAGQVCAVAVRGGDWAVEQNWQLRGFQVDHWVFQLQRDMEFDSLCFKS
jgi:hypothetical protein